jgi:ribosomal protein L37AE/L43A
VSTTDGERPAELVEAPVPHAPRAERQSIGYCPYCAEENLFPLEGGGWECRSCLRAFSVTFRGLVSSSRSRKDARS